MSKIKILTICFIICFLFLISGIVQSKNIIQSQKFKYNILNSIKFNKIKENYVKYAASIYKSFEEVYKIELPNIEVIIDEEEKERKKIYYEGEIIKAQSAGTNRILIGNFYTSVDEYSQQISQKDILILSHMLSHIAVGRIDDELLDEALAGILTLSVTEHVLKKEGRELNYDDEIVRLFFQNPYYGILKNIEKEIGYKEFGEIIKYIKENSYCYPLSIDKFFSLVKQKVGDDKYLLEIKKLDKNRIDEIGIYVVKNDNGFQVKYIYPPYNSYIRDFKYDDLIVKVDRENIDSLEFLRLKIKYARKSLNKKNIVFEVIRNSKKVYLNIPSYGYGKYDELKSDFSDWNEKRKGRIKLIYNFMEDEYIDNFLSIMHGAYTIMRNQYNIKSDVDINIIAQKISGSPSVFFTSNKEKKNIEEKGYFLKTAIYKNFIYFSFKSEKRIPHFNMIDTGEFGKFHNPNFVLSHKIVSSLIPSQDSYFINKIIDYITIFNIVPRIKKGKDSVKSYNNYFTKENFLKLMRKGDTSISVLTFKIFYTIEKKYGSNILRDILKDIKNGEFCGMSEADIVNKIRSKVSEILKDKEIDKVFNKVFNNYIQNFNKI